MQLLTAEWHAILILFSFSYTESYSALVTVLGIEMHQ